MPILFFKTLFFYFFLNLYFTLELISLFKHLRFWFIGLNIVLILIFILN